MQLRNLLRSETAWKVLAEAGVPGHGLELLRIDFPLRASSGPSWGAKTAGELERAIAADEAALAKCVRNALQFLPELSGIPDLPSEASPLAWENLYQTPMDIAFDYCLLRLRPPAKYIEVGSGVSTWLARRARGAASYEIISIDPQPRASIEGVADRIIRATLQESISLLVEESGPETVLFIDGSHFVFPGSDVTHFFFEVLPSLKAGTRVHLHDIYLPMDYPQEHFGRLWSEHYLLGAWLLGGARRLSVDLPGAWMAARIAGNAGEWLPADAPKGFQNAFRDKPSASCWWMSIL